VAIAGTVVEMEVMSPFIFEGVGLLPFVLATGEAVDSIEDVRNKC
jgi:hypothetical protein